MPRCSICKHSGDLHIEVHIELGEDQYDSDDSAFPCMVTFCACTDYDPEFNWEPVDRLN